MPRSLFTFKRLGIDVVPAPTDFLISDYELQQLQNSPQSRLLSLLPDASNLQLFTLALKEYIGLAVYYFVTLRSG